jgi:hypothetical protein
MVSEIVPVQSIVANALGASTDDEKGRGGTVYNGTVFNGPISGHNVIPGTTVTGGTANFNFSG